MRRDYECAKVLRVCEGITCMRRVYGCVKVLRVCEGITDVRGHCGY